MLTELILLFLVTWFRFIVKKVSPMEPTYEWHEMSFHSKWTARASIALCLDLPKTLQSRIGQALMRRSKTDLLDVYTMHAAILDGIVYVYDHSVWAIADGLRRIEKV